MTLDKLFEQFLMEKQYVQNCAPKTITHYRSAYKTYRRFVAGDEVTQFTINQFVIEARKAGMSVGCLNSYSRGFKFVSGLASRTGANAYTLANQAAQTEEVRPAVVFP